MNDHEYLSTVQVAERLGVSQRRVQELITGGRLPATRMGHSYRIKPEDLRFVSTRRRGRPRHPQTVQGKDIQRRLVAAILAARTERGIQAVVNKYMDLLSVHLLNNHDTSLTPTERAIVAIATIARRLPAEKQVMWRRILIRTAAKRYMETLAEHLAHEHGLCVQVCPVGETNWCLKFYRRDGTGPTATIYRATTL